MKKKKEKLKEISTYKQNAEKGGVIPPFFCVPKEDNKMVHTFICLGVPVAVDVNSGAVHILDKAAYDVLCQTDGPMGARCPQEVYSRLPQYAPTVVDEAWSELVGLQRNGLLFTDDSYIDPAAAVLMQQDAPIKALCLHVSHDCNLRCQYCFASVSGKSQILCHLSQLLDCQLLKTVTLTIPAYWFSSFIRLFRNIGTRLFGDAESDQPRCLRIAHFKWFTVFILFFDIAFPLIWSVPICTC